MDSVWVHLFFQLSSNSIVIIFKFLPNWTKMFSQFCFNMTLALLLVRVNNFSCNDVIDSNIISFVYFLFWIASVCSLWSPLFPLRDSFLFLIVFRMWVLHIFWILAFATLIALIFLILLLSLLSIFIVYMWSVFPLQFKKIILPSVTNLFSNVISNLWLHFCFTNSILFYL